MVSCFLTLMSSFFSTYVVTGGLYPVIRHGEALGKVTAACGQLAVRSAVLGHERLCHAGVGSGDVYGVFKLFLIDPHLVFSSLIPGPFAANVTARGSRRVAEVHKRAVLLLIGGNELLKPG